MRTEGTSVCNVLDVPTRFYYTVCPFLRAGVTDTVRSNVVD